MKHILIKEPGGPEALVPADTDIPEPGPGQVLVKVSAAGVNRPDVLQRKGLYPPPPGATAIPGLEVAGEVVRVNGHFDFPKEGDEVCALLDSGGYAEYAVAHAELCLPLPVGLSVIEAAAIPETFFTVWSNVFDRGQLTSGESFLVHGGSSGIGTTAIQMAKAFGARVYTTAGSAEKCRACCDLGADLAVNYNESDFVEEITHATEGKGVDVVLDMVAGDYVNRNLKLMAEEGRLIIIAGLGGFKAQVDLLPLMLKRIMLSGSTLRPRPVRFKAEIANKLRQHVWPLIEQGSIKPVIFETLTLEQARQAHRLMESGRHIGKIVLTNH